MQSRLLYVDGLRGLAALYVVLFHARLASLWQTQTYGLPEWLVWMTSPLRYGHEAVSLFIVLSGFCLMRPVAQSPDQQLPGGIGQYLRRRAKRILPPYYSILILSLSLAFFLPEIFHSMKLWETSFPLTNGAIISHGVLLHNIHPDWIYKINGPLWSLATEEQVYLLFPFVLLPLWRQLGAVAVLVIAFALGVAPHFLFHGRFDWAFPWYLGLFATGMAAAITAFSNSKTVQVCRERIPWATAALVLGLAALWAVAVKPKGAYFWGFWVVSDATVGAAVACLLVAGVVAKGKATTSPLWLRFLESPWAIGLGLFSYSIYIVHFPALAIFDWVMAPLILSHTTLFITRMLVGVPFAIGMAYLFFLLVERWFLPSHLQTDRTR